jgi:hypothetical protein
VQRADLDLAAGAEREALVRDVGSVIAATISRALGPQMPMVVQLDVRSTTTAPSGIRSLNHFLSAMP